MQHISLPEMNKYHWLVQQRPRYQIQGCEGTFQRVYFQENVLRNSVIFKTLF
jgi:hypothetical protein